MSDTNKPAGQGTNPKRLGDRALKPSADHGPIAIIRRDGTEHALCLHAPAKATTAAPTSGGPKPAA
jgi:hypothetical protein